LDNTGESGALPGLLQGKAPRNPGNPSQAAQIAAGPIGPGSFAPSVDAATRNAFCAVAILISLRFAVGAWLPLSFDEAYYWLWSKHLALGYYDHPALIAFAIRAGTAIFGDTEFGVRFVPLVASVAASWAVWRSAAILLASERSGATACLLFNATLMIAAETMGATPDSLLIAAASFLLWTMAKLGTTQDGRWWLAAGLAAGMSLFAKYTGFFLCGSLVFWLLASPAGRPWLRTWWPYAGALIALSLFAPTYYWNMTHDFISFRFQFGRMGAGRANATNVLEFVGSQIALASPFVLVLAGIGLARNSPLASPTRPLGVAAATVWPALVYFSVHALHDRVQGNWPCFLYPALAVLAAYPLAKGFEHALRGRLVRLSRILILPVAAAILTVAYAQAFFGLVPLGRHDPIARMMAVGFAPVAEEISAEAARMHAAAIVTTNYATTSWLSFYTRRSVPVVQITDDFRFLSSPRATAALLNGPLLYVTQAPEREIPAVRSHFARIAFWGRIARSHDGMAIGTFDVYTLSGLRGAPLGRLP